MDPTTTTQTGSCFSWISMLLQKIYQKLCKNNQTCQQEKFNWTPTHHEAFLYLKESITQAPVLHYPDPNKKYIVYTDDSGDNCGVQLSQEHDSLLLFSCTLFWKHKESGA